MSAGDFVKKQMNLKVSLDLDTQLTWGELYRFVDLARSSGYLDDEPVGVEYNDNMELTGLSIYLAPDEVATPSAAEVARLFNAPTTGEPVYDNYNPVN